MGGIDDSGTAGLDNNGYIKDLKIWNTKMLTSDLEPRQDTASVEYPGLEFAVDATELVGAPHSVEVRYEHAPDATAPDARHMGIVLDGVLHTGESFDAHTEHFGFARRHWSLGAADASRLVVGHAFAEGDYAANVAVRLHDADGMLMQHEETVRSAYAQDEFGRNHHSVAVARGGHLLAVGAPSYDNQAAPAPHSTANNDNYGVVQFFEYRESEEACAAPSVNPIPADVAQHWLDNWHRTNGVLE